MRARSQLEEAATLYKELGEQWKYDRCLTQLARISTLQGEYEQAQELLEQSPGALPRPGRQRVSWLGTLPPQTRIGNRENRA